MKHNLQLYAEMLLIITVIISLGTNIFRVVLNFMQTLSIRLLEYYRTNLRSKHFIIVQTTSLIIKYTTEYANAIIKTNVVKCTRLQSALIPSWISV